MSNVCQMASNNLSKEDFCLLILVLRPDNGAQTSRFHDSEGDSQYLRDLPNYNSSSEVIVKYTT